MTENLGQKIRLRRKERGLTQEELADLSGVSFRAIQKIEDGTSVPKVDTLTLLCQALGISIGEIVAFDTERARGLSPYAVTGPVTVKDGALILSQIADISPERRALILAILFDDASVIPESMSDLGDGLSQLLSTIG